MRIENFIRKIRLEKDMSLRELSKLTGISKSKLSRIENATDIKLTDLHLIAKALNVDVFKLYSVAW